MEFCKVAAEIRDFVKQAELLRIIDRWGYGIKLAQTNPGLFNTFKHFVTQAPPTTQSLLRKNPGMLQNYFTMFQTTGSLPWLSTMGQTGQTGRQMAQGFSGLPSLGGMSGMSGMGGSARGNQVANMAKLKRIGENAASAGVSPNAYTRMGGF